jgi:hypothetical protein
LHCLRKVVRSFLECSRTFAGRHGLINKTKLKAAGGTTNTNASVSGDTKAAIVDWKSSDFANKVFLSVVYPQAVCRYVNSRIRSQSHHNTTRKHGVSSQQSYKEPKCSGLLIVRHWLSLRSRGPSTKNNRSSYAGGLMPYSRANMASTASCGPGAREPTFQGIGVVYNVPRYAKSLGEGSALRRLQEAGGPQDREN